MCTYQLFKPLSIYKKVFQAKARTILWPFTKNTEFIEFYELPKKMHFKDSHGPVWSPVYTHTHTYIYYIYIYSNTFHWKKDDYWGGIFSERLFNFSKFQFCSFWTNTKDIHVDIYILKIHQFNMSKMLYIYVYIYIYTHKHIYFHTFPSRVWQG